MSNSGIENSGDVIDLTNSFILADHCGIANVIIDLDSDDSFCDNDRRDDRASDTQCFAKGAKPSLRLTAIENTNKKKNAKQKSPTSIKAKETSSLPGNSKKFGGCPICWDELGKSKGRETNWRVSGLKEWVVGWLYDARRGQRDARLRSLLWVHFISPPPEAKNLLIGQKRKRGRPSKSKPALIIQ
ncbi:uncharacterized protein LOC110382438 isoform X2 [Helicoverpa armigera]|uniref:uncharacterized protein LOC110382438 isoform X2 n=1 Tax=Helicoverpa armigera TaxID=29058 RepID=UPI003083E65C